MPNANALRDREMRGGRIFPDDHYSSEPGFILQNQKNPSPSLDEALKEHDQSVTAFLGLNTPTIMTIKEYLTSHYKNGVKFLLVLQNFDLHHFYGTASHYLIPATKKDIMSLGLHGYISVSGLNIPVYLDKKGKFERSMLFKSDTTLLEDPQNVNGLPDKATQLIANVIETLVKANNPDKPLVKARIEFEGGASIEWDFREHSKKANSNE